MSTINLANDWKVPVRQAAEDNLLGWVREAVQQGRNDQKLQRPYTDMNEALNIIAGTDGEKLPAYRSTVRMNRSKRQIREAVATLSDLRILGGFQTDNRDLYKQAGVLDTLGRAWYLNTFADRAMRSAMQYAAVLGTGYLRPVYKRDQWSAGRGDLYLEAYGPEEVLFVQMPRDNDLQRAYAVIIIQEVPIAMAHAMYPDYQDKITPTRSAPSLVQRGVKAVQKWLSPALNVSGPNASRSDMVIYPTVDMYHIYVLDTSVNNSNQTQPMGKPGTSWFYNVPSIGSDIPAGKNSAGQTIYRRAEYQDCMMYPLRRLIVSTDTVRIYDDTAPDWHGKAPVVKFTVDDWPWEQMGFSMVRDVAPLQKAKNDNLRAIQDKVQVGLQPPLSYDIDAVSKSHAERLDTRKPNQKIGIKAQINEQPFRSILTPEFMRIDPVALEVNNTYDEMMDYQLGIHDITAFAKARMATNPDAMEKLMELAGPIVKDASRGMERGVRDLYEMVKSGFFQYYNAPRRVQMLGEDGITEQDYDYEPGSMVPSHAPDEMESKPSEDGGKPTMTAPNSPSRFTSLERAKMWAQSFYFHITPYSLHNITQMSQKMLYLQLFRSGFPLDWWSVAEACQVPNFGPPPKGTTNVMERWMAQKDIEMEQNIEMQQKIAAAQAAAQGGPAAAPGSVPGGPTGPNGGPRGTGGRAPSGGAPPKIVQKDGGARSTVKESR
jgi:hypothetical protein